VLKVSLKAFHVIFIVFSTLLALGFGAWGVWQFRATGDVGALICGTVSFLGAVVLVVYGRWFLKKLQRISFL